MPHRLAASLGLIAFATCLLAGGLVAGNTFATTIQRALAAMAGTYALGLLVGVAGRKMIEESVRFEQEKLRKTRTEAGPKDR